MLRCQKCLTILICLSILASTISSYAEEEIEDLIDIAESNRQNYSYYKGEKDNFRLILGRNEKVLWSGVKRLFRCIFNQFDRFFVISTSSDAWQALSLTVRRIRKRSCVLIAAILLYW